MHSLLVKRLLEQLPAVKKTSLTFGVLAADACGKKSTEINYEQSASRQQQQAGKNQQTTDSHL